MEAMKTHRLKTWPEHFGVLDLDIKKAEMRLDDRDFKDGDLLILQEYDPIKEKYSGAAIIKKVTHILRNHTGIVPGHVVMSIRPIGTIKGKCFICRCTDINCRQCIEKTGEPCNWVNEEQTLCSACAFEGMEVENV